MGGQVSLSRIGKGIGGAVVTQRLQRVGRRPGRIAIIDDQRRAAAPADSFPDMAGQCCAGLANFAGGQAGGGDRGGRKAGGGGGDGAFTVTAKALADRQRIEEFIGDDDHGPVIGHGVERVMPARRQAFGLGAAQYRAGFDQRQRDAIGKARLPGADPHRIGHQRAAPGPEFHKPQRWRAGA